MSAKKFQIFYGWYIVAALFLIWTICHGLVILSFTAYIDPLTSTFGWNYTQITVAASLRSLVYVIFMPVTGFIVDHWSAKKLVLSGVVLASIGVFSLSWINTLWQFYLCYIVMGLGTSACTATIPLTLVGRWFRKKLSFATGILMSGTGIGGLIVPLVTRNIDVLGWHTAMLIISVSMLIILAPISFLIRPYPEQYGYLPDGDVTGEPDAGKEKKPVQNKAVDIGVKQALKSRPFWHVSIAFMFHAMAVHAVTTHIMPFLSTIGSDRMASSFITSALAILSIIGRLSFGWFGDKFNKKLIAASGTTLVGLSLILFSNITTISLWTLLPAIMLFGIGWGGSITLHSVILKESFGTSNLGAIIGFSISVSSFGMMAGPPLVSLIYESFGEYRIAWFIVIGVVIISVISQLTNPSISIGKRTPVRV
ncbi:MAG: MFS transporter [Dehalococcoidia bacterium]